jgi:zinc transport system ATP-binding protein
MKNSIPAIEIRDLCINYGTRPVIQNLNFTLYSGDSVVITGENGSGKTTLLRGILGLIKPDLGNIYVFGRKVGTSDWLKNRKEIGYANQENIPTDFPISGYEVVEIGTTSLNLSKQENKELVQEKLKLLGCLKFAHKPYYNLSGGEKQRISLARCLVQSPSILLLDEPTAFLDPDKRKEFLNQLEELKENLGLTILMVSHDYHILSYLKEKSYNLSHGSFSQKLKEQII